MSVISSYVHSLIYSELTQITSPMCQKEVFTSPGDSLIDDYIPKKVVNFTEDSDTDGEENSDSESVSNPNPNSGSAQGAQSEPATESRPKPEPTLKDESNIQVSDSKTQLSPCTPISHTPPSRTPKLSEFSDRYSYFLLSY